MSGALSELVALYRQQKAPVQRERGTRLSPAPPSSRGFARGSAGSTGAVTFQPRNPYAKEEREMNILRSPEFQQFFEHFHTQTPVRDFLMAQVPR